MPVIASTAPKKRRTPGAPPARRRRAASGPDISRTVTTVRLRDDLHDYLAAEAKRRNWTVAAVLEHLVEAAAGSSGPGSSRGGSSR